MFTVISPEGASNGLKGTRFARAAVGMPDEEHRTKMRKIRPRRYPINPRPVASSGRHRHNPNSRTTSSREWNGIHGMFCCGFLHSYKSTWSSIPRWRNSAGNLPWTAPLRLGIGPDQLLLPGINPHQECGAHFRPSLACHYVDTRKQEGGITEFAKLSSKADW